MASIFSDVLDEFRPVGPFVLAFVIGCAGGLVFHILDTPVPWLLGSLIATIIAGLAGVPLRLPRSLRNVAMAILGTLVGSGFQSGFFGQVIAWIPSLLLMLVVVLVATPVAYLIFRRMAGWSRATAMIAAVPGGFGAMVMVAEEIGADVHSVSIAHMFRIISVIMLMPVVIQWLAGGTLDLSLTETDTRIAADTADWILLILCAVLGPWIGRLLSLPAAVILGAMLVSGAVHFAGFIDGSAPSWMVSAVQVVTGTWLGASFAGQDRRALLRMLGVSIVVTVVTMPPVLGAAWLFARYSGFELLPLTLAFAPGGMPEMSLIALALNLDPSFVLAHHLVRMGILTFLGPLLLTPWLKRHGEYNPLRGTTATSADSARASSHKNSEPQHAKSAPEDKT